MQKVLVVDDDDQLRTAMCTILKENNFEVTKAVSGRLAREILLTEKFDLIISDIQMPDYTGIDLLKWVREKSDVGFLLITGFSNLLETFSAHELGADEFLLKPFKTKALLEAVNRVLEKKPSDVIKTNKKNYYKVSISEFVSRSTIDFDVYVRLSEDKFVKVGHKGNSLPSSQVQKYQANGVKYLYIRKEDFPKLIDFNIKVGKALAKNNNVSSEKKLQFLKYTGEVILERAFIEGVNKESFNEAKDYLELTINTLAEDEDSLDLLSMLSNHSDEVYAQSVGTSIYSIIISKRMGLSSPKILFLLSMAGMYHEIGKKEIEREILEKPRAKLTPEEIKLIESHPTRGRKILETMENMPDDVIQLVYEHHEDCLGQGYPQGLRQDQAHPLSKILQLSSLFIEMSLKSPDHPKREAHEALEQIETTCKNHYDPDCLKALKSAFNEPRAVS